MSQISPAAIKGFSEAAQSLKLYRRAELREPNTDEPLIERLYVDPLQNDSVLDAVLLPNTTVIIGRKGTGKSTVFQRAQHELRKRKRALSAYVDIKTVYESAEVNPEIGQMIAEADGGLPEKELRKILLYRAFIRAVFLEIQQELKNQITGSLVGRLKEAVSSNRNEVIEALNELLEDTFEADVTDVSAITATAVKKTAKSRQGTSDGLSGEVGATATGGPAAKLAFGEKQNNESATSDEHQYSKLLLRTFNLTGIIEKLQQLLAGLGISQLYVFIDDFSELPPDAMTVFVDAVLAPLNNWSNELFKFKIAGYPGRLYYGKIDVTKIDEVHLDTFQLYGGNDVSSMEEKAIDFTHRLLNNRTKHFAKQDLAYFCEAAPDEVVRHFFFASMGNPRMLGHILNNLKESHLAYGHKIGIKAIQDAASKYYEEKIEPFFGNQKFVHESFQERSSVFSLKELLEATVTRARELKRYKESSVTKDISGWTPSSHFHVLSELDLLMSTLELNFFLTKYYEMKDRDGRKVSVYALNYGLCAKFSIAFGRPEGKREHRLYYVERIFDFTTILRKYIQQNQEIRCDSCNAVHGLDKLQSLSLFDMLCPTCRKGTCQIINLSRKYESVLKSIDNNLLLPATELGILETLFTENRELLASEIAGELDCSYQLVGKRAVKMEQRQLLLREQNEKSRRVYRLTNHAVDEYFRNNEDRRLSVPPETADKIE